MTTLPSQWTLVDNSLTRTFLFEDFDSAFEFASEIADIASEIEHHPTITISWGKVVVTTTTHDKGNTVTDLDYELAKMINQLFEDEMDNVDYDEDEDDLEYGDGSFADDEE